MKCAFQCRSTESGCLCGIDAGVRNSQQIGWGRKTGLPKTIQNGRAGNLNEWPEKDVPKGDEKSPYAAGEGNEALQLYPGSVSLDKEKPLLQHS